MRVPTDALDRFVAESNAIEGIHRAPYDREINAHLHVLAADEVTVELLERFVKAVQPGAKLRRRAGMNVRVGDHVAPRGGPAIEASLIPLLRADLTPFERHVQYERLHPFMDGNGRSGRVLWLHDMGGIENAPLGFLHTFYYQALSASHSEASG